LPSRGRTHTMCNMRRRIETGATSYDGTGIALSVLAIAAFCAYASGFSGVFLLDDSNAIANNPYVRSPSSLFDLVRTPPNTAVTGRPLVALTLALNHAAGGLDPWGYHFINVAVHILASCILFGIVRRTLRGEGLPEHMRRNSSTLAFTVALLWMLHPVHTQSVTYIVQRGESLMGLFFLLTLYCSIRSFESPQPARWRAAAAASCLAGVGCKETIAVAPVTVLLYDRAFVGPSFRALLRDRWRLYAGLALSWLALAPLVLFGGRLAATRDSLAGVTPLAYAMTQPAVVLHYIRLVVWPRPLVLHYGWPLAETGSDVLAPGLAVTALLGVTAVLFWKWSRLGYAGVWFFLILAPSSSFVPVAKEVAAEHRLYLPLAAAVTLAVLGMNEVIRGLAAEKPQGAQLRGILGVLFFGTVAIVLCGLTAVRNRDYCSRERMWKDVVEKRPENPLGHNNLGLHYALEKQPAVAAECFARAVKLKPDDPVPHLNLGGSLAELGRSDEAIEQFKRAVRLKPNLFAANINLVTCLAATGRFEEAKESARKAVALAGPRERDALAAKLREAIDRHRME
jgi:tetratricopeptide (TPR) repeat protein